MIINVLLYTVVVEILKWRPFPVHQEIDILRYVLLGVAIAEIAFIGVFRRFFKRGPWMEGKTREQIIEGLLTMSLITYALCESIVVYGLIFFFLGGSAMDFYSFLVLWFIACIIYFPRYGQWEEWGKFREIKDLSMP